MTDQSETPEGSALLRIAELERRPAAVEGLVKSLREELTETHRVATAGASTIPAEPPSPAVEPAAVPVTPAAAPLSAPAEPAVKAVFVPVARADAPARCAS